MKSVVSTCYGKLSALQKMKNSTSFSTQKMLAESLILSKTDLNDYVYSLPKQCQLKKLHHLQKAVASFVIKRYVHTEDILRIWWLPIAERREFNILKLTFKAIHETNWPEMIKLDIQTCSRSLLIPNTFQDATAANSLNALPSAIKTETSYSKFYGGFKQLLAERAKSSWTILYIIFSPSFHFYFFPFNITEIVK